jgi:hypothetical protein
MHLCLTRFAHVPTKIDFDFVDLSIPHMEELGVAERRPADPFGLVDHESLVAFDHNLLEGEFRDGRAVGLAATEILRTTNAIAIRSGEAEILRNQLFVRRATLVL